jgi:kinesin family protein 1
VQCEKVIDDSRQLEKAVGYNFLILDGRVAGPTSLMDQLHGVTEFEDVSASLGETDAPILVIKVIDRGARGERL